MLQTADCVGSESDTSELYSQTFSSEDKFGLCVQAYLCSDLNEIWEEMKVALSGNHSSSDTSMNCL